MISERSLSNMAPYGGEWSTMGLRLDVQVA